MIRVLLRALPRDWRAAIEGDLEEESRRSPRRPWRRRWWIARQIAIVVLRFAAARVVDRLAAASPPAPRRWIGDALLDLRHGARRWRARPVFAASAVATLAIGVGSTAALFSIVDGVLLKPLPYPDPDRLVSVYRTYPDWVKDPILSASWDRISLASPEFFHLAAKTRTIEALAVTTTRVTILGGGPAQELRVGVASAGFFPLLGVRPALGALFAPEDDERDPSTAIVSYDTWQSRFGGDPALVGRTVHLEGEDRVVIGVLPRGFAWGNRLTPYHLWVPLSAIPVRERDENRNLDAIARLRPGVSRAAAQDEVAALLRETLRSSEATGGRVSPLFQRQLDRVRKPLLLLLGGAVLLLAIACANVAGLLVGDAASREGEMAVRVSLGAGRGRLLRQLFAEGLLLAGVGSAAGLMIALWGVRALVALAPNNLPRLAEIAVDSRVVAFASSAGILTALLLAIVPALGCRRGPAGALRSAGRGSTARRRATAALALAEIAFAVALLAGAGLFWRSLAALEAVDAGFERSNLLTLRAWVPPARTSDPARIADYFRQAREALAALPGVAAVTMTSNLAFGSGRASTRVTLVEPRPGQPVTVEAQRRFVANAYFQTMRIAVLEGRDFLDSDAPGAPLVAIVSREMARRFWTGGALGQRFVTSDKRPHQVVGVVNDVRDLALDTPTEATFYLSTAQNRVWPTMRLVARTSGDPAALAGAARAAVSRVDPGVPIEDVTTMQDLVDRSTSDQRYRAMLMMVFAAVAVVLAGVGLYGTLARRVADRHREIGVRLALGARPAEVRRLFLVEGLGLALAGTAAGIPAALAFGRWASSLLFGVEPSDPATLAGVTLAIGAVAVLATYVPAVRASRLDPLTVLRE